MIGVIVDITERKQAEEAMKARLRIASATQAKSSKELMQMTLDTIEEQTDSAIGFYHFLLEDQETLSLQTWSTNTLRNMCTAEGEGSHYPISQAGVWVDCVHERVPIIHNDYNALPHLKGMPPGHAPVMRELVVPIFRDERIVAIIGVGNKPTEYDAGDIDIISHLGDFSWEIVERKRAEEALRNSEAQLRAILDATPFPIALVDIQDNNINFWSRSALTLFGYTAPTAPEWYLIAYPNPDYRREVIDRWKIALEKARQSAQAVNTGEYRVTCRDGSVRICELYAAFLSDRLIVTFNDITKRKGAEEALKEERRRLQQALDEVRTLRGILPICAHCKKIRDDEGYWNQLEKYVSDHTEAMFSHGICPDCMKKIYPEFSEEGNK
jgi:PAS domain S-box-containing protein